MNAAGDHSREGMRLRQRCSTPYIVLRQVCYVLISGVGFIERRVAGLESLKVWEGYVLVEVDL